MNIWSILGIQPTNDIRAIKKAYAKRSREIHPEESPEEFSELHNAYEQALKYAKGESYESVSIYSQQKDVDVEDEITETQNIFVEGFDFNAEAMDAEFDEIVKNKVIEMRKIAVVEKAVEEFYILNKNKTARNDIDNWKRVLNNFFETGMAKNQYALDCLADFIFDAYDIHIRVLDLISNSFELDKLSSSQNKGIYKRLWLAVNKARGTEGIKLQSKMSDVKAFIFLPLLFGVPVLTLAYSLENNIDGRLLTTFLFMAALFLRIIFTRK